MKNREQIKKLNDSALLDEVKSLVRREKEIVVQVIEYLKEIELRQLHLARGYSSMFAFTTDFLGYSEAKAHIRIQAARLTQVLPEAKNLLENGKISLSVVATAQTHIRKENLRRKEYGEQALSIDEKREVLELVVGHSRREAEHSLNILFGQRSAKTLSFEASPELAAKIERLMDLMAHKNFDRDLAKMVETLVDGELARYEKRLRLDRNKQSEPEALEESVSKDGEVQSGECHERQKKIFPEETKQSALRASSQFGKNLSGSSDKRSIPRETRALVWAKSSGQCTYRDPLTGKLCAAKHALQVDHKRAFSKGGSHQTGNLTLLCRNHNAWKGQRSVE